MQRTLRVSLVVMALVLVLGLGTAGAKMLDMVPGNAAMSKGDYPAAIAAYGKVIESAPAGIPQAKQDKLSLVRVLGRRAMCYIRTKQYPPALPDLDRAITIRPNDYGLHSLRSHVALKLGKTELAIADAERATELAPKKYIGFLSLGMALQKTGKTAEAKAAYERVLELKPGHRLATDALAHIKKAK